MTDLGDLTDEQRATLTREFGYNPCLGTPLQPLPDYGRYDRFLL